VCVVLCFFGGLLLAAAYFKLFQKEVGLTSIVTVIYLASYLLPPIFYDFRNFWTNLGDQLKGIIAYFLTIPMYQIVFQLFAYANLHDVTWGNRDAAAIG
jgi:cellulose synthase/poly-beta-1,6-N-acetylglucosamine synthase-like glycosyltransferase